MYATEISLQITVKDDETARECPTCKGASVPSDRLYTAIRDAWQKRVYRAGLQPSRIDAESLGENLYVMNMKALAPTHDAAVQFALSLQPFLHHPTLQLVEDTHTGNTRSMKLRIADPSAENPSGFAQDIYTRLTEATA